MSESKRPCSDLDPDYDNCIVPSNQKRLKDIENDNKEATIRKIEGIIKTQFNKERQLKDLELDNIDQRLYEARRMLDQLRACIVVSYYNADDLCTNSVQRKQTTVVHPAVRKLLNRLSKTSSILDQSQKVTSERIRTLSLKQDGQSKGDSGEERVPNASEDSRGVSSVEACEDSGRGARFKLKKRIVVGNVSKYIPVDKREERDQSTHKWMIYVRGSKEEPRIDHFVKKVWFFLHPSYRPNDLVEVNQPPFHLTRRGWGEFPIRIQLQFHDSRNKRVDILHTLKLDKSYTGLQTLGAETVVDVHIYKPETGSNLNLMAAASVTSSALNEEPLSEGTTIDECVNSQTESVSDDVVTIKEEPLEAVQQTIQPSSTLNSVDSVRSLNAPIGEHESVESSSNATVANESQPSTSSTLAPPTANGLSTFVKCADKHGNFFLIPMAMFLKLNSEMQASVIQSVVAASSNVTSNHVSSQSLKQWSSAPVVRLQTTSSMTPPTSFTVSSPDKAKVAVPASKGPVSLLSTVAIPTPQKPPENSNSIVKRVNLLKLKTPATDGVLANSPVTLNNHLQSKDNRKNHRSYDCVVSKLSLDSFEFMDVIMKHILKYYPLVDPLHDKATHPYCSTSVAQFLSWNIGKRHAAEWQRSRAIRNKLLQLCKQCTKWKESQIWSVKNIMMFCRYYCYTPMKTSGSENGSSVAISLSDFCTYTDVSGLLDRLDNIEASVNDPVDSEEDEVDILTVETVQKGKSVSTPVKSPNNTNPFLLRLPLSPGAAFVRDSMKQIGVHVGFEEAIPGVLAPLVEEMMFVVTQSFMEDIMRAGYAAAFERNGSNRSPPSELAAIDVIKAVSQLRNCDFLTDRFMGTKKQTHHSLNQENVRL